jgi:curli production assembly/transport component CsgG
MLKKSLVISVLLVLIAACGARIKQPFETESARIGEETKPENSILEGVLPEEPIVVGVYKFRDQTGQYKQVDIGTSWSTAVTQGATTILLKSLEDSKWFTPIERENVSNLLNERQIIRSTRQQYSNGQGGQSEADLLPPLLFAGVIMEGGIISYDSNIVTGGVGARYFGTGASSKYREDRITIYLRAVSTSNGKILKTVYISKTILSQAISASVFRYVDVKRLLEVEVGITQNEPKQLAVQEAIDKAVESLIIEGIMDGLWTPQGGPLVTHRISEAYTRELEEAKRTKLYNRTFDDRRSRHSAGLIMGGALMNGDYSRQDVSYNLKLNYKFLFDSVKKWGLNVEAGVLELDQNNDVSRNFDTTIDVNMEYIFLPYENISPYIFAGGGTISDRSFSDVNFKVQFGLGVEYLPVDFLGLRLYGEQNITFTDELDGLIQGNRNDFFWRFGLGVNFYFGN